ncbi:MAG: restriction endonuclease subunit S [Bacteroidia bacterium]|nr:restriction endonuclease subunit S [Bacteroidia bacterium]
MPTQKRIPELRFPEFEGEWMEKRLGSITSKIGSGKTPTGGELIYEKKGIPFIRSQNVNDNQLILDETHIPAEVHKEMGGSKVFANDILLNITGASIGRSCVVPADFGEGNVNQHVAIIRLKNGSSKFLQSILSSWFGQKLIYQGQTGSGREGLNFESIKQFKIHFPSLPEQQKIAAFLTAVDKKIGLLQQKKTLLETWKKGLMQQIFSQQLRFKDDEGRDFPDWEKAEFLELVSKSKVKHNPMVEPSNYPCIELESISQNTGILLQIFSSTDQKSIKNKFLKGDILLGKLRPYLRKFLIAPFDGVCSSEIWVLRGAKLHNLFLYYLIQTNKFQAVANVSSGSKMPRSDWNHVSGTPFFYPSLAEQQKIADFLSSVDKMIANLGRQVEGAQGFKKGLLQRMFV